MYPHGSCISFVSYIKPQLGDFIMLHIKVVYLSFPTSNHNFILHVLRAFLVVYLSFPTSNHNFSSFVLNSLLLYIFRFLHQTTTFSACVVLYISCISFVSYIKPQPYNVIYLITIVVYLSFPTSNHNM